MKESLLAQLKADGSAPVDSVVFSPRRHTLASGSFDGTIQLWDVTNPAHPRPLGQPLTGTGSAVISVAYSPDGRTLASGNGDSTIQLWDLNVRFAIERICITTKGLTHQQWNQYIPQLQYKQSCAH